MNPSRGLPAALLCVLLVSSVASAIEVPNGACAGRGGPAASPILTGPAFDLRAHPLPPAVMADWRVAGYGVNASSSQLLSPTGRPVVAAEYERLSAPYDAAVDAMANGAWSGLIFTGYRLQDSTCRILDPEKHQPVTRIEVLGFERRIGDSRGFTALEELLVALKHADPNKPPSAAVLARLAELEARGEKLPESILRAFADRTLTAGALRGRAEGTYAEALRAWEGSRGLKDLADAALPPVSGYNVPALRKGRIEAWEQVIGDGFSSDMQALFSRTEAGRELLGRFKDAKGRPDLPKMTVLKMSQRPNDAGYGGAAAVYDETSRTVILNHWFVVGQILAAAAPAERAKLGAQLVDSRALAEYLRAHPAARAAVADRVDVTLFHELTHAWQYRRQTLGVETMRGNAPSGIILAHEHEAFFGMYRYLHEKLMRDPDAAVRSPDFGGYLAMMNDPEKYRDQITRQYQAGIAASTDFKTLEQVQAERRKVLGVPAGSGPVAWARALLERAGLSRGDAALRQARDDQAEKERTFLSSTVPQMRREAGGRLPAALGAIGRPDLGLQVLAVAPASSGGAVDLRPGLAASTAAMLARRPASVSLEDRLNAFSALAAELRREKKTMPAATAAAYGLDALEFAGRYADQAEDAREPGQRAVLLKAARAWLPAMPGNDPRTRAFKARLDALERKR